MNKSIYMCIICGYLYNEAEMKQRSSGLSEDWGRPDCHSCKENFAEIVIKPCAYKNLS
jgi:rubredoxin